MFYVVLFSFLIWFFGILKSKDIDERTKIKRLSTVIKISFLLLIISILFHVSESIGKQGFPMLNFLPSTFYFYIVRGNFKATPAPYVKTDMDLLLKWYNQNKNKIHPLTLAVIFHHKFEKIHPFMDGNGRTGRMLLNYILIKNNYPPLIIRNKNRDSYLENMRKADKSDLFKSKIGAYFGLAKFGAREFIENYWNIFL